MENKLFLCGGAVRDILCNKKPKDMDYVVLVSSYEEMRNFILSSGGKIFQERPEYQIIRGSLPDVGAADFVLPRKDGAYSDNRRPDSTEIADNLFEDSRRRDFTVNAMYQDVHTGQIIDYHGGKDDLKNLRLQTVGKAYDRFNEDPLRMMRAIRFNLTKGFINVSSSIVDCLNNPALIEKYKTSVAIERTMEELKKCFEYDTELTLGLIEQFHKFFYGAVFVNSPRNKNAKIKLIPTIYYGKS